MPSQGLYGLLLGAIQEKHQREFGAPGVLSTEVRHPDSNFRQLSRAPFVERLQAIAQGFEQPDGEFGAPPMSPALTPMPVRFRGGSTSLPFPGQSPSAPPSSASPPGAAELWKAIEPLWEMYRRSRPSGGSPAPWPTDSWSVPESIRKRPLDELDEGRDADTAAGPIHELHQARRKEPRSKASGRPDWIQNGPSVVPDADADASAAAAAEDEARDFCFQRYTKEEKRCRKKFPKNYHGCEKNAVTRMTQCYANKGRPPVDETEIWDNDE